MTMSKGWVSQAQPQCWPNQGPAAAGASAAADADRGDELSEVDAGEEGDGDEACQGGGEASEPEPASAAGAAGASGGGGDPLRAERRRSNQLEKELRKARAQLARFSEINPDEYARLQQAEQEREQRERQWGQREQELNDANRRRVQAVEKERDDAKQQVLGLRKERQLERLFADAQGRVGGDETGTFFDTFVTLCGHQFRLGEGEGREGLVPLDGKGQPLSRDGVVVTAADRVEELRRHPVYSFLFQQRSGLYPAGAGDAGVDHGQPASLQSMSTRELYLEAMRSSSPRTGLNPR
jgi:hypothetical protein